MRRGLAAAAANAALLGAVAVAAGATDAASVAFVALAAAFAGAEAGAHHHEDVVGDDGPLAAVTGLALLAVFCVSLAYRRAPFGAEAAGGALMIAGIAMRVAAMRALGPRFVTGVLPLGSTPLVDSGVYRYVRHPSEVGLLAIAAGGALLLSSWIGLAAAAAVLAPLSRLRVRREGCLAATDTRNR